MRQPPRIPSGNTNEARFAIWVTECILAMQRGNIPGLLTLQRNRPRRPTGSGYEWQLAYWFYDTIIRYRPRETRGVLVSKTTRGVIHRAA
jgi:hypothetical protein